MATHIEPAALESWPEVACTSRSNDATGAVLRHPTERRADPCAVPRNTVRDKKVTVLKLDESPTARKATTQPEVGGSP